MTNKPTRQQIVDALAKTVGHYLKVWDLDGEFTGHHACVRVADILIRAGLAVEPREEQVKAEDVSAILLEMIKKLEKLIDKH